ncbi:MAG: PAS domain S-box protein [Candidatus Wildermuthbacteria bacterium]|nr:PAS domain S-box protein [Candidatus Wildermuthbacteria bacterium]
MEKLNTLPQGEKQRDKLTVLMEDVALMERYVHELTTFFPLPLCFISPLGVILEVNPMFEEEFGYAFHELIGEPLSAITSKENADSIVKEILAKESIRGRECVFFTKKEKKISTSLFAKVRRDEKEQVLGFFLSIFDLTEIKEAEREIKKNMEELAERTREIEDSRKALLNMLEDVEEARRLATDERDKTVSIITNLVDGLFVFDSEDRVSFVNPEAERMFDAQARNILGKSLSDLASVDGLQPLADALAYGLNEAISRQEIYPKNTRTAEVSVIPMKTEHKRVGSIVVLHDVTREREVEKMKTEFVSIAAHQLRTPLSAIKWTLRMLLDGDMGKLEENQKEFLLKTYRSNERMIELVNDLLNVTKIEEGKFLSQRVPLNIVDIVSSAVRSFKEEAAHKRIALRFSKPKTALPRISADEEKIRFAAQNLLDNALRYTQPGGSVVVNLRQNGKQIEASFQDTGIGIPAEEQRHVFEKFFRASNAKKIDTEGSGLGLYMVKNIIEAHGGQLSFATKENKGSTFVFVLPIAGRKTPPRVARGAKEAYHKTGRKEKTAV